MSATRCNLAFLCVPPYFHSGNNSSSSPLDGLSILAKEPQFLQNVEKGLHAPPRHHENHKNSKETHEQFGCIIVCRTDDQIEHQQHNSCVCDVAQKCEHNREKVNSSSPFAKVKISQNSKLFGLYTLPVSAHQFRVVRTSSPKSSLHTNGFRNTKNNHNVNTNGKKKKRKKKTSSNLLHFYAIEGNPATLQSLKELHPHVLEQLLQLNYGELSFLVDSTHLVRNESANGSNHQVADLLLQPQPTKLSRKSATLHNNLSKSLSIDSDNNSDTDDSQHNSSSSTEDDDLDSDDDNENNVPILKNGLTKNKTEKNTKNQDVNRNSESAQKYCRHATSGSSRTSSTSQPNAQNGGSTNSNNHYPDNNSSDEGEDDDDEGGDEQEDNSRNKQPPTPLGTPPGDKFFCKVSIIDGTRKVKNHTTYWVQRNVVTIQVLTSFEFEECRVYCHKENTNDNKHMETLSFAEHFARQPNGNANANGNAASSSNDSASSATTTNVVSVAENHNNQAKHQVYEATFKKKLPFTSGRPETQKHIWVSAEFYSSSKLVAKCATDKFFVCSRPGAEINQPKARTRVTSDLTSAAIPKKHPMQHTHMATSAAAATASQLQQQKHSNSAIGETIITPHPVRQPSPSPSSSYMNSQPSNQVYPSHVPSSAHTPMTPVTTSPGTPQQQYKAPYNPQNDRYSPVPRSQSPVVSAQPSHSTNPLNSISGSMVNHSSIHPNSHSHQMHHSMYQHSPAATSSSAPITIPSISEITSVPPRGQQVLHSQNVSPLSSTSSPMQLSPATHHPSQSSDIPSVSPTLVNYISSQKAHLSIQSIYPQAGPTAGNQLVTLSGHFFIPAQERSETLTIYFGLIPSPRIDYVDSNKILCLTPQRFIAGTVRVTGVIGGKMFDNFVLYTYSDDQSNNSGASNNHHNAALQWNPQNGSLQLQQHSHSHQ